MIPARGHVISFKLEPTEGRRPWERRPVIAWDDDGRPLIAGRRSLVYPDAIDVIDGQPVTSWRLDEDDGYEATVPGGGWMVTQRFAEGDTRTTPVVAWQISPDGWGRPLIADPDGVITADNDTATETTYWHPAGTEQAAEEVDP